MRGQTFRARRIVTPCFIVVATTFLGAWDSAPLRAADDSKPASEKRVAVGKCLSPDGSLVQRTHEGQPWQPLHKDAAIMSGDLLVAAPMAVLETKDGGLLVNLESNMDGRSPYPVIETAVILHENAAVDLDVTLDRGRVDLTNKKAKGAAKVKVHFCKHNWDVTLDEPGARVALEIYGRWQKGVPFNKDSANEGPCVDVVFLVLKGQANLNAGGHAFAMHAPPGPALFQWDSVAGPDPRPQRLETLPEWSADDDFSTPKGKERLEGIQAFRKIMLEKSLDDAIAMMLESEIPRRRRFAVYALGAFDNVAGIGRLMASETNPDLWDTSVSALRHWLGRKPGQDLKMYNMLIKKYKFKPVHAEIALQLLHSFGEAELAQPETYEMLIDYLKHERLAIRKLAYWHLCRLVPQGKGLAYAPLDPPEKLEAGYLEWKKLVPTGKLPPKLKSAKN